MSAGAKMMTKAQRSGRRGPKWFDADELGRVIGQSFVGDRNRLHVADVRLVAFNSVQLSTLCRAGSGGGRDVSTTVTNVHLDVDSEQEDVALWWAEKVTLDAESSIEDQLSKGLRRPRMCGACVRIRDGEDPA